MSTQDSITEILKRVDDLDVETNTENLPQFPSNPVPESSMKKTLILRVPKKPLQALAVAAKV